MAALSNAAKYDALAYLSGTLKLAFYAAAATVDATTAAYTATNEVTQAGATPAINAGGLALGIRTLTASDGSVATAGLDYPDLGPITPNAQFTFQKVLIYDTGRSNRCVLFHDYGTPQVWNAGTPYTLTIPGSGSYVVTLA